MIAYPVPSTLLALVAAIAPLAAADTVGPFQWARKLLAADPATQTLAQVAANGVVESALLAAGSTATNGGITLVQWTAANRAGTSSTGGNTLRGEPGKAYAIGLNTWTNYEALNTGEGWIQVSRYQQDSKLTLLYIGANQTPAPLVHGATLDMNSIMPAPALALTLVFRRVQGGQGDSAWQTGYYSGNPLQMSVTEIPAGKTLMQAQAEAGAVRRLATLDALAETTPDRPVQVELRVGAGGLWQASLDLDGDGAMDADLAAGVNGAKPYTVGDIDASGGLYVSTAPAQGSPTGTVGVTTLNLTYRETSGAWVTSLRNRRPIRIARTHASRVSPAVIQGGAWKADRTVTVTPVGIIDAFSNGVFLAKIPLDAATEGANVVFSQTGTPTTDVPVSIQWQTTSVAAGGSYTIKTGDRLLLVADSGYTDSRTLLIDPTGSGQDVRSGTGEARHVVLYAQPGTYRATAYDDTNHNGLGEPSEAIGFITITVVDFALPKYIPNGNGFTREFILDTGTIPANQLRLAQATNSKITVGALNPAGTSLRTTLKPGANNEPVLEARTAAGTLLDARSLATFDFSLPTGSVIPVKKLFRDGSTILDGQLRMAPLRPNLDIVLSVYVTGAAFTDGGLRISLPSNGFTVDAGGVGTQHFDLVKSGKIASGPCHTATVYHLTTAVGQ